MPVPPSSLEDEESTTQNQLKTAYERISVLETRVHDLSLQVTLVRRFITKFCINHYDNN